jgi:hypothetical protein
MGLKTEIDKLKYDKRMTDWYVNRGHLKPEDLQKYLDSIPDSAANVANLDEAKDEVEDDVSGEDV